jgi:hypothetical protein
LLVDEVIVVAAWIGDLEAGDSVTAVWAVYAAKLDHFI